MKKNAGVIRTILLTLLMVSSLIDVYPQSGPGGVGNSDGSDGEPEIKLWLLPDSLGLADGNNVLTWTDYSGNTNDLSAVVATSPIFKAAAINGHDYLEFSQDNNRIIRNAFDMPTDAVAVFMVVRTADSGDGVLSYAVPADDNHYLLYQSNSLTTYISGSNNNSGIDYSDSNWKIFGHQWRSSDGRLYIHIDGTESHNVTFQSGATITTGGTIAIGGEQDGVNSGYNAGQDFDGDIAEFILFGSSLKQADRVVIENYLAQKYGLDANLPQDRYVPGDVTYMVALTGMGKEMDGTTELESDGLVVTQNGGFDNGEYIFAAHDGTVNSINKTPADVLYADIEARWQRDWYVDKSGVVNAKIAFDFSEGINGLYPANIENYRLLYKANLGDSYDTVTVAGRGIQNGDQIYFSVNNAQLLDGYYGLASVDTTNSPLEGVSGRSWYTLVSGDWDNWEVWTLDPSGALPNNPDHLTPTTSPTAAADKVFILTGKTVTVSTNNKDHSTITVDGRLDIAGTSGHDFGEIKGTGRILLSSDNFPTGDATDFITAGQGEGTVEYYGTSFNLVQAREFFDVEINMDDPNQTLTLLNDYTINGDLRITQGEWQFNDNSSTTNLNVTVHGELGIETNGKLLTGTGNARHQLNLYGNFTNNGTAEFTNRVAANYGSEASDGIVDVNFLSDDSDQRAYCNGPTNFYRIEIDKGTDETYKLILETSAAANFNLFGYANENHGSIAQLTANNNALGLIKGTVQIKSNINIPVLSTASNYNVSEAARLWVDGGTVLKNSGNSLVPYGKIYVTAGTLEARVSSGITTRENGLIKIDGGTINTNVIRTSVLGASNVGGYVQSGGTVNVVNAAGSTPDYYHFNLTYSGNVFNMSGGTLHIFDARVSAGNEGGIFIASDPENINVTGGTVIAEISASIDTFKITSTAPFYNLILRNTLNNTTHFKLTKGTNISSTNENLAAQPLVVLNDLTIEANAFLNHNGSDVYIGRDFYIDRNAQTKTFDNTGLNDSFNNYNVGYLFDQAIPNNTIFNGSEDGEFYIGYNTSDGFEQYFTDFTVNKSAGSRITIVCDNEKTAQYQDDNNRNHWYARLPRIEDQLTVTSGILDQGQSAFRLFGPVSIGANGQCGEWIQGTTHPWAWLMLKDADLNINTEEGAVIGNIKMNPNPTTDIITFTSDVYIKRIGYFHGRFNLQSYELKLDYLIDGLTTNNYDIDDGRASDEMFYSSGNASDGGLLLYIPAGTADGTVFPFPLGVSGKYTPAEVELSNVTDDGYIRITPVDAELQTTNLSGGDLLDYYWRVDYQDFTTNPTIDRLRFDYNNADIVGTEANYVAGKVLDEYPFDRIYEDETIPESEGVDAGNNRITFNGQTDTGFTLEKANYTAGETGRFSGSPEIFYVRQNGDWNNGNTWSFSRGGAAAGDYPQVGDIAIMRRTSVSYSGIVTVRQAEQAAAVIFDDENGFSSGCPRIIFDTQSNYASYNSDFDVVDVADSHEGGTLNYNTHGAVIQYNIEDNYSGASNSLEFDGANDYVAIQNYNYNSAGLTEFTVECWIKTNDAGDQVIASFDRNQYWRLEVNGDGAANGQIGFDVMTSSGQLDFGGSTRIDDDTWHHVAGVFDNGTVTIYIDGVVDNTTTTGATFGSAGVTRYGFLGVGSEADTYDGPKGPTNYFNGNISEFRVWSVARSQPEIQAAMNSSLTGAEAGLEIYYKLDGSGSDVTATDYTTNGNTGDLNSFTLPGAWTNEHPWGSGFPGGDFGGFNQYPNALVIYAWDGATANADVTLSAQATEYPQMWFQGGNNNRIFRFPNNDVTVHGGFTVPGDVIVVANGESDNTITMEQNMNVGHSTCCGYQGQFLFPGDATGVVTLDVKKNIYVKGQATPTSVLGIENASGGTTVHKLKVEGDIDIQVEGGRIQLGDGDPGKSNVELELTGSGDNAFTNSSSVDPQFYRIIMNKGSDTTSTFTFNNNFSITGTTDGVGAEKAIELQNGKLVLNHASINVDLTTGDDDFYIPGSAGLEVRLGQANANGGSGILLDGKLQVSGGTVDMSGGDNYIQYSAGGGATIEVSAGSLIVGSQIRRGLSSSEGILNYIQSGGDVIVGNNTAPENNRGVFEILNSGSNFTHTGGNLHIARAQDNPSFAAVYLDPETSTFGEGTKLRLGYSNTPANQTIGIYSTVNIPNLVVDASSATPPTVQQWTVPLTITDSLEIDAGAIFDANGLDLILNGDLIVNGDFTPNNNTTYFSGTGNQQIVGSPVFWNLTKDASGTLNLNNNITVNNVLRHENGTISDGGNDLSVKGDVYFDGNHTWGGSGDGILLNGTEQQNLQGNGTYGKLSINNTSGVYVPVGNDIIVDDALQLENGIFDIGRNLLELDEDAIIIEANSFSESNMIQTNISFTDAGVKKYFPAIVPADNYSFIYPMGSEGKYTPVEFTINNVNAGGYIRVKAANEIHPTVINDTEPCNQIEDTANVLKYHWLLEANSISGFTADASMKYYPEDYQVPEAPYDVSAYIAARLLLGSTQWNKYDQASFDETNELLLFSFANTDDDGVSGDYTAGVEDPAGTCEGAIPDEVPTYITISDGDWTNAAIWESYPTPGEYPVPSGGPRGAIAIVEHIVDIPGNYILSYKTQINAPNGIVKVGTTFGHRLGIVEGTGTLQLERGSLPAGIYDDFFSRSGGTLEYAGNTDYDVLSEITNVRNIIFSGTGERRLPNLDFEVYGEFTIDGSDANLWVINEHDRNMALDSNVVFNLGKFDAGIGTSTVTFNGTQEQVISGTGSFTGTNAFRNVIVNNANDITLSRPVEIDGTLAFTSGIINTTATNILTVDNASETAVSGYNSSNYVDGPMRKLVQSNGNFEFPLGDAGRYGPVNIYNTTNASSAYWIAEYFNSAYIDNTYTGNLSAVSTTEYWDITNPTSGDAAKVELRWDSNSDITPLTTGDINQIVVAEYNGSDWQDVTSDAPVGTNYNGTVKTTNAINIDTKHYTLGSEVVISAQAYFTTLDDVCEGVGIPVSFAGVDGTNLNFTLDYDYFDGSTTTSNTVTVSALPYSLPTTDGPGTYTLTAFDYNNPPNAGPVVNGVVDGNSVTVNAAPAQPTITPVDGDPSLTFCAGGNVTLTSSAGTTYLWSTGATTQNINVIATGNYTVQVTNAAGCYSVASNPKTVTVNSLPVFTPSAVPASICFGETSQLDANFNDGSTTYVWSPAGELDNSGIENPVYTPTTNPTSPVQVTTTFSVTVTDSNSCSDVETVDVTLTRMPETGPQYHIDNSWGN